MGKVGPLSLSLFINSKEEDDSLPAANHFQQIKFAKLCVCVYVSPHNQNYREKMAS